MAKAEATLTLSSPMLCSRMLMAVQHSWLASSNLQLHFLSVNIEV